MYFLKEKKKKFFKQFSFTFSEQQAPNYDSDCIIIHHSDIGYLVLVDSLATRFLDIDYHPALKYRIYLRIEQSCYQTAG
jgi:hypothetical protein